MRSNLDERRLRKRGCPDAFPVDCDVRARWGHDIDLREFRACLRDAIVRIGSLFVSDVLSLRQELFEVTVGFERMSRLQAAPREVQQNGWMLF
jgi:hypothetical protein